MLALSKQSEGLNLAITTSGDSHFFHTELIEVSLFALGGQACRGARITSTPRLVAPVIIACPIASLFRASPGPEVVVTPNAPA